MRSAIDLLDELNALDESTRIEAKRASDLGKSVMETVIAFANEPGLDGGYLLLGVDWSINDKGDTVYRPAGLPDPDKVQRDLASQCACMLNVALRPDMQLQQVEGRTLLVVYVPEADVTLKPIYKKATGLPSGAWRRIGSSDQRCVDEDLWVLRGTSQPLHGPDSSILPDARMDDFDPAALAAYRRERARINPQAEELAYGDEDMLEALCALRRSDGRRCVRRSPGCRCPFCRRAPISAPWLPGRRSGSHCAWATTSAQQRTISPCWIRCRRNSVMWTAARPAGWSTMQHSARCPGAVRWRRVLP